VGETRRRPRAHVRTREVDSACVAGDHSVMPPFPSSVITDSRAPLRAATLDSGSRFTRSVGAATRSTPRRHKRSPTEMPERPGLALAGPLT
jgi:hypothetical protein